jgi:hypothetical protein
MLDFLTLPPIKPDQQLYWMTMNLSRLVLPLLLCLPASLLYAAPDAKGAAPQMPADIQTVMVQRCASEAAAAKITDAKTAQKVCSCTIGIQANNLKLGEFWAIQSAALNNRDPNSIPAFTRIQPLLAKCREGVTLKMPAAPSPTAQKK